MLPTAEFGGSVAAADGQPAGGVEVFVYHLATGELLSATTGQDGLYEFVALPYGYYDLAVRAADGIYVGQEVV
nr:hypothetical protein [Acidobacteriota bacterium]NIM63213.1 hypothetical protein [Acidobacteriota bacterium]NIO58868.1 hypothetical protein [Acidobacteriota bacterium]NIQ29920.1 hypothetical protein [Acidobacteriota bacterium]NIQ84652.1 hypothetical protein [Acidobacteriota bacterium]